MNNADRMGDPCRSMQAFSHQPVTVRDKRAVIVGGTSGIGEAIALGFAADGANVIASSRRRAAVERTAGRLEHLGASTARVAVDVTDQSSITELRDEAMDALGGIDIIVTSQGAISREAVLEISDAEWSRVLDVQLNGVKRVIQTLAPSIDGHGAIVVISSLAARLAMANLPAYAAAKGGVEALTRAAAKELAPAIRVNAIAPGFVITPQNEEVYAEGTEKRQRIDSRCPLGRVAERDEIVGAAIYLASDAASYTTAEVMTVDGGFAPSAL